MKGKLLDWMLVLFVKILSYIGIGLVASIWLLVVLALVINLYKLFV